MKKFLSVLFAITFLVVVVACGNDDDNGSTDDNGDDTPEVRVALITHSPDSIIDDGSFNEGTWNGIRRFFEEQGLDPDEYADFFIPHTASDEARLEIFEQAIDAGFDVLVLPGFHHNNALYMAQDYFPDTTFIIIDATPTNLDGEVRIEDNVVAVHHSEEEAGFLAGYAAVREGYRDLGFMGGIPIPNILAFGYGYILGAEHAAQYLELEAGEVTVNYSYLNQFSPDPTITTAAAAWFADGVEVIFAAAGGAGASVMAAAENAEAAVIGVDDDQYHISDSVVFSALKRVDVSVHTMLTDFINDAFRGGQIIRLDATYNGVGLALENARLENFTQADFDAIFEAIQNGDVVVDVDLDPDTFPATELVTVNER